MQDETCQDGRPYQLELDMDFGDLTVLLPESNSVRITDEFNCINSDVPLDNQDMEKVATLVDALKGVLRNLSASDTASFER